MLKISFRAMGCHMEAMTASESSQAHTCSREVPGWFEEWESSVSRFRPESELSRLNSQPEVPLAVSDTLADVIENAMEMERISGGLVSPTVLNAVIAAGYDKSFELIGSLRSGLWPEPCNSLELHPEEVRFIRRRLQTIMLPYGTGLDFGGTAKGWAADQAAGRLSAKGPALVNAGGDIAVNPATIQIMSGLFRSMILSKGEIIWECWL